MSYLDGVKRVAANNRRVRPSELSVWDSEYMELHRGHTIEIRCTFPKCDHVQPDVGVDVIGVILQWNDHVRRGHG